jgi:hypothetical protein
MMTMLGSLAAVGVVGVLSIAPATSAAAHTARSAGTGQVAAGKCPVDHHVYASAKSAKRSGSSVKVRVHLGKADCGPDGEGFKFAKRVTILTVHKGAIVKVIKNVIASGKDARIPVAELPHYVNRSISKNDDNVFRVTGHRSAVKDFVQIFIS